MILIQLEMFSKLRFFYMNVVIDLHVFVLFLVCLEH